MLFDCYTTKQISNSTNKVTWSSSQKKYSNMGKSKLLIRMSLDELKKGSIYALVNAFQLYGDGLIMDSLGRVPRVYSFTKLSLEEAGKAIMLNELYLLKKMNFPDLENSERFKLIIKSLEDHNLKTEYALRFLIIKESEFIKFHSVKQTEDSTLYKSIEELEELISKIKRLDTKKNTSLYTSVIDNKFLPPLFSTSKEDITEIIHRTFQLLVRARQTIMKDDDDYYESIGLDRDIKENMDPNLEAKNMHKLIVGYQSQNESIKRQFPNLDL